MVNEKQTLGQQGERTALLFLKTRGFTILETNYKTKQAEIDIIAKDNDTICFIEIKTRRSVKKGLPRESVTYSKQKKIITGAMFYLKKHKLMESKIRFDVIELLAKNTRFTVNLIQHAFQIR